MKVRMEEKIIVTAQALDSGVVFFGENHASKCAFGAAAV